MTHTRPPSHHAVCFLLGVCGLVCAMGAAAQSLDSVAAAPYGLRFVCAPNRLDQLLPAMPRYLHQLGIPMEAVAQTVDRAHGHVTYALRLPPENTSTLYLAWNPALAIHDDDLRVPTHHGQTHRVSTVSQKEIVLALLHPGRLTEFRDRACDIEALADHVGIRQNTVMWAEVLAWVWPDGGAAHWNRRYWHDGTPRRGVALQDALNDLFFEQKKYTVGCYTATKMVFAQGVLDYYLRVKKDPQTARHVAQRLLQDGEPLVHMEPGGMWRFEADFNAADGMRPGKLLRLLEPVAAGNFVPGDWVYFLNTDARSYQKTGYEGSNAIYLGRNRFDDYYNDNLHHYSYKEKLGEVFQWRNDVFSRSRDFAKRQPLSAEDWERLGSTPAQGGLLMSYRAVPYQFGFEPLPPVTPARAPAPDTPERHASPAKPAAHGV